MLKGSKVEGVAPGSAEGARSATGGSRSCRRKGGRSALWSVGGRRDEPRDLRGYRQALWPGAGLPGARISPLDGLCAAGAGIGQRRGLAPVAAWSETEPSGRRSFGRNPCRLGSLALYWRRSPQGLGAASDPAWHPRLPYSRPVIASPPCSRLPRSRWPNWAPPAPMPVGA